MTLYIYVKASVNNQKSRPNGDRLIYTAFKSLPYLSILSGFILLLIVTFPIISYKLLIISKNRTRLISPISESTLIEAKGFINPIGSSVLSAQEKNPRPEIDNDIDYNLINNWFPSVPLPRIKPSKITHYSFSISKLKIKEAIVTIGGQEIKETLVHYPGTALPGEYGNTVIFGHSVLPIFYNPRNYETIFSKIPTLEKGDKINIYFDGVEYIYQVEDYFEVDPENVQVLEQHFNEQTLSLVTCVPPGTYKKRGIIKARLIRI